MPQPIPLILLALMVVGGLVFIGLHWRFHIRQTPLDSFEALQRRLRGGKPALLQFHAPL